MGILQVQSIGLSFGDRTLLDNVSMTLGEHARAALVGGNGEGKSTLMKCICSMMPCDTGIVTATRGMRISYLPQSDIVFRSCTVYEEIEKGFSRFQSNLDRQHEIEDLLSAGDAANQDSLLEELSKLQDSLADSTYYGRDAVISTIAKGLGFRQSDLGRQCAEFSGGYQMRIALAKVLAEEPDLMMLDEPTNYLDIEARLWLKEWLRTYRGSLLIVCHDKGFLDDTVTEVYELFGGKVSRYSGNYTFYENQRRLELEQLENAWKKQQAEIGKTEDFIERFRYKATKAKQVQSRVKQLEKLQPIVVPSHLKTLKFSFPQPPHSPNDVIVIDHMTKKYGNAAIFKDFSLVVEKGRKLAVTGHNGAGKSTLLRMMAGVDSDYSGVVRLGPGVMTGYFSQDTADSLDMQSTVFGQVSAYGTEGQIRNALGSFLFSGDDIDKKATVLSGGERSRLALLKILLQPANLLILDEPTNHLDINSKDMLLKALKEFTGTIVFVSHDAYFIKALADRILYLSDGEPELFDGDYDYFEWKLDQRIGVEGTNPREMKADKVSDEQFKASFGFQNTNSKEDRAAANKLKNRKRKLEQEVESLLAKADELQMKVCEVNALMNLSENYSNAVRIAELAGEKKELEMLISQTEEEWAAKSAELEQMG